MKKTITINGANFEPKKYEICKNGICDIYDLYEKPSQAKIDAFDERDERLDGIYWMRGGSHFFSIFGYITDEDGERYEVYITRDHNYYLK